MFVHITFVLAAVVFALGYSAVRHEETAAAAVVRPLDAKALVKKLETLDARLAETQATIDEVVVKLASASESERDATRIRLDVLYRLERGLTADIARVREALVR